MADTTYYEYDTIIQSRVTEGDVSKTVIVYPVTKWGNIVDAPEVGDLSELTTTDKTSLVAAINEAARTGSSSGGGASSFYMVKQYRDVVYAEFEGQTDFEITFDNWDPAVDFDMLTVVSGRLPLTPVEDYSVNGNVLTLVEGIEAGRNLSLYLLRNEEIGEGKPHKVARFREQLQAETEGQTVFEIVEIPNFDSSTDMVTLTSGRTFLTEDLDFTIAGNTLTLTEGIPLGRRMMIYVLRNVEVADEPVVDTETTGIIMTASNGKRYMIDITDTEGMTYTEIVD